MRLIITVFLIILFSVPSFSQNMQDSFTVAKLIKRELNTNSKFPNAYTRAEIKRSRQGFYYLELRASERLTNALHGFSKSLVDSTFRDACEETIFPKLETLSKRYDFPIIFEVILVDFLGITVISNYSDVSKL